MSASKFLLKSLLKQHRQLKKNGGFTLLELLVALVLTFLIITPLLSLVVSMMNTDRQEQAKTSSQQEIQAALDYMAQDLQQAIYVYDATALSKNSSTNPAQSGILNQIPPNSGQVNGCNNPSECIPVLAFWKRKYFDRNDKITDPVNKNQVNIGEINDSNKGSDRYVYSLVVYYLIKNSSTNTTQTWSPIARIGRFEVSDGISTSSPNGTTSYSLYPDPGFSQFNLSAVPGSLQQSLNSWMKSNSAYTQSVQILVDYIDDTPLTNFPISMRSQIKPPDNDTQDTNNNNAIASNECQSRLVSDSAQASSSSTPLPMASRVPPDTIDQLKTGSFYACVKPINNQGQSVVQIYLRGNALPHLNSNSQTWKINPNNLSYAPIANVRVAVRGLLGGESK